MAYSRRRRSPETSSFLRLVVDDDSERKDLIEEGGDQSDQGDDPVQSSDDGTTLIPDQALTPDQRRQRFAVISSVNGGEAPISVPPDPRKYQARALLDAGRIEEAEMLVNQESFCTGLLALQQFIEQHRRHSRLRPLETIQLQFIPAIIADNFRDINLFRELCHVADPIVAQSRFASKPAYWICVFEAVLSRNIAGAASLLKSI